MRGDSAALLLSWLLLAGCQTKAPQPEFQVPAQESSRQNPVKPTADSIAQGNQSYLKSDCAVCHGKNGNGKGFMSGASHYDCRDWRDPSSLKDFTDGDLFYILNKGKGKMPGYERRLHSQEGWVMITFIRSLPKQTLGFQTPAASPASGDRSAIPFATTGGHAFFPRSRGGQSTVMRVPAVVPVTSHGVPVS
jgi:mono/diheme cytochrome c family protein